jgi:type IV secretion system protein TrbC
MERTLQVCLDGEVQEPAHTAVPSIAIRFPSYSRSQRGLPLNGPFLRLERVRENPDMKRFLCRYLRSSWLRSPLVTLGFTLFLAAPAFAQQGNSPWENAVSVLQQAFTSTIARGLSLVAIVVAGLTFAFGEGGSKRVLAGVLFGVGMAIAAVNFLSWLFPGN